MPSGMGGVNGVVRYTVVDSLGVPPLTPVSLLKQVRAVIDLNSDTMELKRIETTTSLRVLPSGHVAHKLTASGGWRAPTPEQTKLFQARSGDFIPMILPGELRPRRQRQSADLSSGFAYMVSIRPHPFSCHRDVIMTGGMIQWTPTSHPVTSQLKNRPCSTQAPEDSMPAHQRRDHTPVAQMRWRRLTLRCLVHVTRATWQAVLDSRQRASSQIAQTECTHSPWNIVRRANQWASMDVCDKKGGRCGVIMNCYSTAAASAHREARAKAKEKGKVCTTISQRAARIVSGGAVEEEKDNA